MNLIWLKLIKRILTHKYWDDKMSSLANECRILGYIP